MIPIPDILLKTFIQLDKVDPESVARAFYDAMINYDTNFQEDSNEIASSTDTETEDDEDVNASEKNPVTSSKTASTKQKESSTSFSSSFSHVLQFCYLCTKGKIPPLLFTVATDNETTVWFEKIEHASITTIPSTILFAHSSVFSTNTNPLPN
jgi:hypothetical protein